MHTLAPCTPATASHRTLFALSNLLLFTAQSTLTTEPCVLNLPMAGAKTTSKQGRQPLPPAQHQGRVQRESAGGGPAASRIASSTTTATAAPAPWKAPELQAFSRIDSSRLIASRVIFAAGSTGTARRLVRTLERALLLLLPPGLVCLSLT